MLFFNVELLSDVDTLLYIITDSPLQLGREAVLFTELFECLEVFASFDILGADVADESAYPVDVIGEAHDTDNFYENKAKGFLIGCRVEIAKSHRQHDVHSPVVSPDVLFKPKSILNPSKLVPVFSGVDIRHRSEEDCQYMSKAKVEQDHLNQRPVLLVMVVLDKADLQFLHFFHALRQLGDDE